HSSNPIDHLNKAVERRADGVGIFRNGASITRPIGTVLFEPNDEWKTANRAMMVEAFAKIEPFANTDHEETDPIRSPTTEAARLSPQATHDIPTA
ncbi:MAG: transposase, partial [Pseudomonadota bacterium]